ncbi:L-aspartate oxidase [Rhodococcus aerolatus]
MSPRWEARADLVVVGSGVAGLTAALDAAERGLRVLVVTKGELDDSATAWAQGGIAVVGAEARAAGDRVAAHVADTLTAGVGLCDEVAVRSLLAAGDTALTRLRARGARFDLGPDGRLATTREGGHSARRVVHAGGDATGAEVERALVAAARAGGASPVVLAGHVARQVVTAPHGVTGLVVLDTEGVAGLVHAPAVLLATGGLGHLYATTTNPPIATGDGLALALRAGVPLADVEFVQFHPTALVGGDRAGQLPLVTEAVRGEGGVLVDLAGERVMAGVHPLADLAPRDVVAAAITRRMAATGTDHVLLDARGVPDFAARFPTVHAACAARGIDPVRDPIPVAPAAHYSCGGVVTDTAGRTGLPGLLAAGEVGRTGLHGANRLASNSLLEGLVVAERAAAAAVERVASAPRADADPRPEAPAPVLTRARLQQLMSAHAAVGRDAAGLALVATALAAAPVVDPPVRAGEEDRALTLVASAVVAAATARTESRGAHLRSDHPGTDEAQRRSTPVVLDDTGTPVVLDDAGAPVVASLVAAGVAS